MVNRLDLVSFVLRSVVDCSVSHTTSSTSPGTICHVLETCPTSWRTVSAHEPSGEGQELSLIFYGQAPALPIPNSFQFTLGFHWNGLVLLTSHATNFKAARVVAIQAYLEVLNLNHQPPFAPHTRDLISNQYHQFGVVWHSAPD